MGEEQALDIFGSETFVFELREEFLNKVVDIEFCCCGHVKKAVKGVLVEVGKDFIQLVARAADEPIIVILFGADNQQFDEEIYKIIIPISHICSVEDPCKPCKCHDETCAEDQK